MAFEFFYSLLFGGSLSPNREEVVGKGGGRGGGRMEGVILFVVCPSA